MRGSRPAVFPGDVAPALNGEKKLRRSFFSAYLTLGVCVNLCNLCNPKQNTLDRGEEKKTCAQSSLLIVQLA